MAFPWPLKILIKLFLSRLPVEYASWRKLNIFKHGNMNNADYAYNVFRKHYERSGLNREKEFVGLELGPGDSLLSAIIANGYGASKTYLVDTGDYANKDFQFYVDAIKKMNALNPGINLPGGIKTTDGMLMFSGGRYKTHGIDSLKNIPSASVDFIWSQAVLEHIQRGEMKETLSQMCRILKKDGVCSHRIDLKDHLGGGLQHLRFHRKLWENRITHQSGFYTNRFRYGDYLSLFKNAGFNWHIVHADQWDRLPTPKIRMAEEFRQKPYEELIISGFDVVLSRA